MSSSLTPAAGTAPDRSTPGPLSDDYLAQAEALLNAARPGPWEVHLDEGGLPAGFGPFPWVDVWDESELVPNIEFGRRSRDLVRDLLAEVRRLQARVDQLEHGPVLPWATHLDAEDLDGLLADLVVAADGGDDLATLAAVEKILADWRDIARGR